MQQSQLPMGLAHGKAALHIVALTERKQSPSAQATQRIAPALTMRLKSRIVKIDFNEIHIQDGKVLLYNVKTDAWDIEGDSADIPYYDNGTELLGYNVKSGKWDVPTAVEEVYFDAEAIERNTIEVDKNNELLEARDSR